MTRKRAARPLLLTVSVAVTAACTYLAVRGVALDETADALAGSDLRWLLPAGVVFAAAIVLRVLRWWVLFAVERRPSLRAVSRALFVGYFFNNILPARAGEAARIIALHRRAGTPLAETMSTVVVERVFDVLALLALLFAASPLLPPIPWLRTAAVFALVALACLAALVVVLVRYDERAVRWLLSPLRRLAPARAAERIDLATRNLTRGLVAVRRPRVAFEGFVLTVASWVVLAVSFWILMAAFSLDLPLVAGVLVTVTINFSLALPSLPAAIGVFEGATVVALRVFDVPQAEALSYALVLHLLNLVPFLVIGAVLLGPGVARRSAPES